MRRLFNPSNSRVGIFGNIEGVPFSTTTVIRSGFIDIRNDCALGSSCNLIVTYLILELQPFNVNAGNRKIEVKNPTITVLSPLVASSAIVGNGKTFVFSPGTALLGVQGKVKYVGVAFSPPAPEQSFMTTNPAPIFGTQTPNGVIRLSGSFSTRLDASDVQATILFDLNTLP